MSCILLICFFFVYTKTSKINILNFNKLNFFSLHFLIPVTYYMQRGRERDLHRIWNAIATLSHIDLPHRDGNRKFYGCRHHFIAIGICHWQKKNIAMSKPVMEQWFSVKRLFMMKVAIKRWKLQLSHVIINRRITIANRYRRRKVIAVWLFLLSHFLHRTQQYPGNNRYITNETMPAILIVPRYHKCRRTRP